VYKSTSLKDLAGELGFVNRLCDHKDMEEQQFRIVYYVSVDGNNTNHQILCWSTRWKKAFSNALRSTSYMAEFGLYFKYLESAEWCAKHLKLFRRVVRHFARYEPSNSTQTSEGERQAPLEVLEVAAARRLSEPESRREKEVRDISQSPVHALR
jgi:hypothetical protein